MPAKAAWRPMMCWATTPHLPVWLGCWRRMCSAMAGQCSWPAAQVAIDFSNRRQKPLSVFVLSEEHQMREAFTARTSSGSLNFGAPGILPGIHGGIPGLPFGGVGHSGLGS